MKYLKYKNKAFFHAAESISAGDVFYLTQFQTDSDMGYIPGGDRYYDLVLIQFVDEGGYQRSLFCPWPIVWDSRTKGAKILREIVRMIPVEDYLDIETYHVSSKWVIDPESDEPLVRAE